MKKLIGNEELIALVKSLIAIPSYVTNDTNEEEIGSFLVNFLNKEFPQLQLKKQFISDNKNRFNIIISGRKDPNILILGHMDTVQPQAGWNTNPLIPVVKNGIISGLGAADMKGALASFLIALKMVKDEIDIERVMAFFYVDEEYDFKGMQEFINKTKTSSLSPEIVLSLDGELDLISGCRGIIEILLRFKGKSGHSSNPKNGINAIEKTVKCIDILKKQLRAYADADLGVTTVNLAFLQGGIMITEAENEKWQREGNMIPDVVDITLEVRPSNKKVQAKLVIEKLKQISKANYLVIENISIRHDIAPWPGSNKSKAIEVLKRLYKNSGLTFRKVPNTFSGYVDIAMLSDRINSPMFVIGTNGKNAHAPNESVKIKSLEQTQKLYENILKTYCSKERNK